MKPINPFFSFPFPFLGWCVVVDLWSVLNPNVFVVIGNQILKNETFIIFCSFFFTSIPPLFASLLYSIVIKSTIPPYTRWIIEILVLYTMYIVLFCSSKPFRFITFLQLHLKKDKGWNWKGYIGKKSKQGDIHMFALRN